MIQTILTQYLLFMAALVAYEGYVIYQSDLALLQSAAIIRHLDKAPIADEGKQLQKGLRLALRSIALSNENPRATHYAGLYLAKFAMMERNEALRGHYLKGANDYLQQASKAMPLHYHLKQDIQYFIDQQRH